MRHIIKEISQKDNTVTITCESPATAKRLLSYLSARNTDIDIRLEEIRVLSSLPVGQGVDYSEFRQ